MKNKFLIILFFLSLIQIGKTSETNQEIISLIESQWNTINTMAGRFEQTDSDGNIDTGNFYFAKPFRSRFSYDEKKETIITSKILIHILDNEGFEIDSYPIINNPLKSILSNHVQFDQVFEITNLITNERYYEINVIEKNLEHPTKQKIIFFFKRSDLELKKWVIIDEFENKTVLEFTNVQKNILIQPNKFVVRYKD